MAVEVVLNNDRIWTRQQVEFYHNHNDAFPDFSDEVYHDSIKRLNDGERCKRANGKYNQYYDIVVNGNVVGGIYILLSSETTGEMDIGIYDEYAGHRYAPEAISDLFIKTQLTTIEAKVEDSNPLKQRIEKMLSELGFNYETVYDEDNIPLLRWVKHLDK